MRSSVGTHQEPEEEDTMQCLAIFCSRLLDLRKVMVSTLSPSSCALSDQARHHCVAERAPDTPADHHDTPREQHDSCEERP